MNLWFIHPKLRPFSPAAVDVAILPCQAGTASTLALPSGEESSTVSIPLFSRNCLSNE